MRIVGGRHRGRRVEAPPGLDVRPTTDRTREALFNVLSHSRWAVAEGDPVAGAAVLDAFCGSGALGLEALSRGAASVVFVDSAPGSLSAVRRNIAALGEGDRATVVRSDARRPPRPRHGPATLAGLDPPYGTGLAGPALAALAEQGWMADGCLCAIEMSTRDRFELPAGFTLIEQRDYGGTRLVFGRAP